MKSSPEKLSPTSDLALENIALHQRLNELLGQARHNQQIMARHQSLELQLIGAPTFRDLLKSIFTTLKKTSELDAVTLCLLDNQNNLKQILTDLKIAPSEFPFLSFAKSASELRLGGQDLTKPILGPYTPAIHEKLFAAPTNKPNCVAVVPLLRQNILLGSLNLGSFQTSRFTPNMATDFIERLASIIAICLENVINRERLTYIGLTDALTNVSNRRFVEQRLIEEVGRARRQKYSIACLYLDIDFFKAINDKHGHQGGDDVLKEVANRIKSELRLSDTLGRFGGEEFVVLLVNANEQDALQVAERIRSSIASKPFSLTMADSCSTSISIGLATLGVNQHKENINICVEELLWRADKALYEAKRSGRNRVCTAP